MTTLRIFISSVQGEFAEERAILRDYVRSDRLIRRFFEVFLFEDTPASDRRPDQLYLDEVERCDVYVGLFGFDYGNEDEEGVSPTEREFDRATATGVHRLVFVKGTGSARHPKMRALIGRAQAGLIRKRFNTAAELVAGLYAALVEYLEGKDLIRWGPFDAAPCARATLDDLDLERMAQFIRTARLVRQFPLPEGTPAPQLLEHLNLLNESRPTNAAVLLFGKSPQRFLLSSDIRCAHFHGTEVAKPIPSYQVYKGTAFDLVDQAVDFVLSKINRSIGTRAESVRAPRTYEIPPEVVTEAIVNAVVHRDYTDNGSVQVMLFADRLEVRNPGRLPPPLTLEKLREAHRSVPGNPLVGEALYLTEYIERMGTGTLDMIRRCVEAGLAEPEFAVTDGFVTTVRRPAPPRQGTEQGMGQIAGQIRKSAESDGGRSRAGGQAEGHAGGQAEDHAGGHVALTAKEITMLQACLDGAVAAETLMAAVGSSTRTGHFRRWLKSLLTGGFLEMTVPDKPRYPAQKYRLTDKGRAAVAADGNRQVEDQGEGQTGGQAEGQAGGQAGGQAEGQAGGQAEGQAGGQAEGQAGGQAEGQVEGQAEGQAEGQVEGQVEGQAALSAKEIAMLQACFDGAVAAEALLAAIGHSSRTGYFRRRLDRLLRDELVEMTAPDKPRNPAQRYRLTNKGQAALGRAAEGHGEPNA